MSSENTSQSWLNKQEDDTGCVYRSDYNRAFTKQRNWEISMQNKIIKDRINATMTKTRCSDSPRQPIKSNMAINRAEKNREIGLENQRLALRIKNVKSTIKK